MNQIMTFNEALQVFSPECLPVIKENLTESWNKIVEEDRIKNLTDAGIKKEIKKLKDERAEIEPICDKLYQDTLEGIWMKDWIGYEGYRDVVFIPLAKTYFYDRIIDPIDVKIKELEQRLKRSQIHAVGTPDAFIDIQKAKQYPLKNLVKVNHSGFATCPFHNEKTASMKVYKDNRFHCFGCGKDGDVIDFVMHRDNVDFKTAIKILNNPF